MAERKERPADDKILRELNRRATAVQDAARGIPERLLTEYETAQRNIEHALRASDEGVREAIERAEAISRKVAEPDEAQRKSFTSDRPTSEEIAAVLVDYPRFQQCGVRDFVLPFTRGHADPDFETQSPVTTVQLGIVGWSDETEPPPRIVNNGDGSGQTINGNLDLRWRTTVPHGGIFAIRPNQGRPSFPVFGNHTVRGQSWSWWSYGARVEVHAWTIVYLGSDWLHARHELISGDAAILGNRTRSFGRWVDLPGKILFQAEGGEQLGMIVRLYGGTWAIEGALAEIDITLFGMPSNVIADMDIDVVD